ncbi:hypothetical protein B0T16DRAFT_224874 [Cercophora newfieldiana]|uniref:Uncharacterized protein n=1 Tax=Cercophora newfieldiana TaxID=92897 RepID=A0AA39XYW6_9PEZI|nr:hypothetical protein B0T16DRAFT_224874 [Cercophora newfieldiana]
MWTPLTAENEPLNPGTWRPEPEGRGTWGILSTCILTLSLCIWSSLHLNIPEHGKAERQLWRKTRWLLIGLFAPEIIAFIAVAQRTKARELRSEINDELGRSLPLRSPADEENTLSGAGPNTAKGSTVGVPRRWESAHGYLALMGGYVFEVSGSRDIQLPDGQTRIALTTKGLLRLASLRRDLFPNISVEEIHKANSLAKTLVCLQAVYFGFHFITRLCLRLGVTLLELNTFAHAVFALIIYMTWWDKPLDIDEPVFISIRDAETASICAAMYLGSRVGREAPVSLPDDFFNSHWSPRLARRLAQGLQARITTCPLSTPQNGRTPSHLDDQSDVIPEDPVSVSQVLLTQDQPIAMGFKGKNGQSQLRSYLLTSSLYDHNPTIHLSREMILLRRLASSTEHGRKILAQSSKKDREYEDNDDAGWDWVVCRRANWPPTTTNSGGYTRTTMAFVMVSTIYGGWHLLAWNGPFNSQTSMILWRVSGLGVAVSGLLAIAIPFGLRYLILALARLYSHSPAARLIPRSWRTWLEERESISRRFLLFIFFPIAGIAVIVLIFCRCYLVIGSLLLLPYSADSVYETPDWALYFPHIG